MVRHRQTAGKIKNGECFKEEKSKPTKEKRIEGDSE